MPRPATDSMWSWPFSESTRVRARNKPRPIRSLECFVVKNGSVARLTTSVSMPCPSSTKRSSTASSRAITSSDTRPRAQASKPLRAMFSTICTRASRGAWSVLTSVRVFHRSACSGSSRCRTSSNTSSTGIDVIVSPMCSPPAAAMRSSTTRQRASSSRMSSASSKSPSAPGSFFAWRSISLAATAIVPSGVPSSCAAPAAKVAIEASFPQRCVRSSASASARSRLRSSSESWLTK